jgi:hypothetical protein
MIRKSGYRFSEKIMLKRKDGAGRLFEESHPALGSSRCRRSCHSKNRDHAGRWSANAPTGVASARPKTFSDATFAAAISTRGITYGFWIMKARCRTRRKIKRSSATRSSARDGGACGPRTTMMSNVASPWRHDTAALRCWLWHHGRSRVRHKPAIQSLPGRCLNFLCRVV